MGTLLQVGKYALAVFAGVLLGNGAVWFFNRIPAEWLTEYGEKPSEELSDPYTQRLKSYPWKYVFTMVFVAAGIYMTWEDWRYAVPALAAMWLLLEMSVSDIKYMIVPDQFIMLLAVTGLGFLPFAGGWKMMLLGAALGFGVTGFAALLGKVIYKETAVGAGDIKLFASLGFVTGLDGMIIIFILTALISAGHLIWRMIRHKVKKGDSVPMVPYIAIAAGIYMIFLSGRSDLALGILFG